MHVAVAPKGHMSALLPDELREERGDVRWQKLIINNLPFHISKEESQQT